jgi:hypothetical protein
MSLRFSCSHLPGQTYEKNRKMGAEIGKTTAVGNLNTENLIQKNPNYTFIPRIPLQGKD